MHKNAYTILLLTTLFWGGNAVAGKLAVGHVSPMLLNTARWGFAFFIICIIGWPRLKADWPKVRERAVYLLLLGAVGFAVYNAALYSALLYTSAVNASIENAGIPMVIFLANFLIFRLRPSSAQMLGFLISLLGVALTVSQGDLSRLLSLDLNFGDLLVLVAVLVYSGYAVLLRVKPQVHWQSLMIALTAGAFLASIPLAAVEAYAGAVILPDALGWGVILYTTIFASLLSQIFFMRGVELIGSNRAGLFINLMPVFGTLLSVILLREAFHLHHAIALALVLGGIALSEAGGRRVATA
ncbi:MAG TPA: DMT family transporter [Rhizobiaceae bacterium]